MKYFIFIIFPFFVLKSFDKIEIIKNIYESLEKENFYQSMYWLEIWQELISKDNIGKIAVMKAYILVAFGYTQNGKNLLEENYQELEREGFSNEQIKFINDFFDFAIKKSNLIYEIELCSRNKKNNIHQPFKLKVKYWKGVGKILVGIILIPTPVSNLLVGKYIIEGFAELTGIIPECLENKKKWEKEVEELKKREIESREKNDE